MTTTHVVLELFASGARPRTSDSVHAQRQAAERAIARCAAAARAPLTGWNRDADSVPVPNEGFCWSIAHKHEVAVVAISTGAVGVDVERIVPRSDDLLDAIASRAEWQIVGRQVAGPQIVGPRTWPAAYRIWTAKEAVLKAVGVGMAGLDKCKVLEWIHQGQTVPQDVWHRFATGATGVNGMDSRRVPEKGHDKQSRDRKGVVSYVNSDRFPAGAALKQPSCICPVTRIAYGGESWLVRHNFVDGSEGEIVVAVASRDDAIAWHLSDDSDGKEERHGVDDIVVSRGLKPADRRAIASGARMDQAS